MDSLMPFLVIILLLLANGLFVAAEFALIGAPRPAIESMAEKGNRMAKLVRDILADPRRQDQYIATAQLGITLASLGLGMYGEHQVALMIEDALGGAFGLSPAVVHTASSVIAISLLTYFHIVIGEMIPKALALHEAGRTALKVAPFMLWTRRIIFPMVFLLNAIGNRLLKLFGVDRGKSESHAGHSAEELQYMVRESQQEGLLSPEAGKLLQEMFDFDQLLAREVLVPRVRTTGIPLGATVAELERMFRAHPHTRYPVYRETIDRIVGMMHVQDVLARILDGRPVAMADVRPVPYVPESATLNAVLEAMRMGRTQLCVVLDEYGGTEGIITLTDLFHEVAGKIPEGAVQKGEIHYDREGVLMVAGTVRVEEVGETLKLPLRHQEVDTVSGLVLSLLGAPPRPGDKAEYQDVVFEVMEVEGRGVKWCKVTRDGIPGNPWLPDD